MTDLEQQFADTVFCTLQKPIGSNPEDLSMERHCSSSFIDLAAADSCEDEQHWLTSLANSFAIAASCRPNFPLTKNN